MKKWFFLYLLLPNLLLAQIQLPLALQTPPVGTSHREMIEFLKQAGSRSKLFDMEFKSKTKLDQAIPVIFYPRRNQWKKDIPLL